MRHRIISPRKTALLLSLSVAALGAVVLTGWALDIPKLTSVFPGLATMKANTALGMLLCGLALGSLSQQAMGPLTRIATGVIAAAVITLGALTLAEYILGWNLGIDQLLFQDVAGAIATSSPGRMSPPSAFCFLVTGAALAVALRPASMRLRLPLQSSFGIVLFSIGVLTLLSYISDVLLRFRFWNYSGMAMHTATGFLLLGYALLLLVRGEGGLTWDLDIVTTGGFAIGILALLGAELAAYQYTTQLQQAEASVSHTQELLKEIQEVHVGMADLESQQRGYIITGDARLLEQREQTKAAVHQDVQDLRQLEASSPDQQGRLDEIEQLIAQRIDFGERSIIIRQQQGFPPAQSMIATGTGIDLSETISGLLKQMTDEETALLSQRQHRTDAISTETFLILPLGVFLSLTMLFLGLFLLNSGMRERNKSEMALRENEERYRTLFEHAPYGIVICDPAGNYLDANASICQMLGYTRTELIGLHASAIVAKTEVPQIEATLSALRTGSGIVREWRLRRKDGSVFSAEAITTTMPDGKILGMVRDITDRKKGEETRSRLAAIVDSSDDAIVGKDLSSIVTSWNAGATKLFGYTESEMVGQSIMCLIPAEREQEEQEIMRRIKQGEHVEHLETVRKRKDGKLIDVSVTVSPIRDATDRIVGASKIVRDITERNRLEQQLRQSQKMEAMGQLTGGVAHDFNNLLGVILGNLEMLERHVTGDEMAEKRVQSAQKATLRGADLTKRLLAFSSRQQLNPAPISVNASIRNVTEMATRVLGPDIKITTTLDESIPSVLVDAAGLENALLNLAVNARDAMPNGGSLTISTGLSELEESYLPVQAKEIMPGRYARVTVSDTGQGMSRETLQRVFEPFFTTKPRGKGTGLGLAMVYGFIKQSGGTVRIYSELGQGTAVAFYLPLAQGVSVLVQMAPGNDSEAKTDGTVLVVDDEVDLLEIAVAYAEDMGFRVLHATDGVSALAVVAREPGIELLITDVLMPGGMNGVELAHKMRQIVPHLKVIYSSGFPSDALAERSGTKVDGPLLSKPFQRVEFVATIRRVMRGGISDSEGKDTATT